MTIRPTRIIACLTMCLLIFAGDRPVSSQESQVSSTAVNHQEAKVSTRQQDSASLPALPVGLTSFGAAVVDDHLYIYGGHQGDAHHYYDKGQNSKLLSLDLNQPTEWKSLGEDIGLQGLALVGHAGRLYRLGGFNARNAESEDQDLVSKQDFCVFDRETGRWQHLDPMPTARSSFDAVVHQDRLYVVGGWAMDGDKETEWADTALCIDLGSTNPEWKELPAPPFKRRAVSVGFAGDRIYVIGGMQQKGGPTTKVAVFDTQNQSWSEGPTLPGEGMEGFGTACFNVGGSLVVSTSSGNVLRLNTDNDEWISIGKLETGRFFHRLLPIDDQRFVILGGVNMESGKQLDCAVMSLKSETDASGGENR